MTSDIDYIDQVPIFDYILGPGDIIRITIAEDLSELDGENKVSGLGIITMTRLKKIYVSRLKTGELTNILNKKFSEHVKSPNVEFEVKTYRGIRFYLNGEVESPGLYSMPGYFSNDKPFDETSDLNSSVLSTQNAYFQTVFDALKLAGGITTYSDLSNIEIVRLNNLSAGGGRLKTYVSLLDLITTGNPEQNIRIYHGGAITVKKPTKILLLKLVLQENPI